MLHLLIYHIIRISILVMGYIHLNNAKIANIHKIIHKVCLVTKKIVFLSRTLNFSEYAIIQQYLIKHNIYENISVRERIF
jgi:hypothetical protein